MPKHSSRAARGVAVGGRAAPLALAAAAGLVLTGGTFAATITQNSLITQNNTDYVYWEGEAFDRVTGPDDDTWRINFNNPGASGGKSVQSPQQNFTGTGSDDLLIYRFAFTSPGDYYLYAFRMGGGDSTFQPPDFNTDPHQDGVNSNRWNGLRVGWNELGPGDPDGAGNDDFPDGSYFATGAQNYRVTAAQVNTPIEFRIEGREANSEYDRFVLHKTSGVASDVLNTLTFSPTTIQNPVPPPPPPVPSFNVIRQDALGVTGGGLDDGLINNMTEGQYVLANGGAAEATDTPEVINYTTNFPGGGGDDFAIRATGVVDIVGGSTLSNVQLTVNSDDGFALKINGVEVGRFEDPRAPADTDISGLTLNDGDILELDFYERGGGEQLQLFRTDNGRFLVGTAASGIDIVPIPEPTGFGLLGLGAVALLVRRRQATWRPA